MTWLLQISELEELHSKAAAFPINLTEAAVLESEISSAKVWLLRTLSILLYDVNMFVLPFEVGSEVELT